MRTLFCTETGIQKKRSPVPGIKKLKMKKVIATVAAFMLVVGLTTTVNAQNDGKKKEGEKKETKKEEKKETKAEKKEEKKADKPK